MSSGFLDYGLGMKNGSRKVKDSLLPAGTGVIEVASAPKAISFKVWVGRPENILERKFASQTEAVLECVEIYSIIAKPFIQAMATPSGETHTNGSIMEVLSACSEDVFADVVE